MSTRITRPIGALAAISLVTICTCQIDIDPSGTLGVTIGNTRFEFSLLDVFTPFAISANSAPQPQAARINLFDEARDEPKSGLLTLSATDVQAIALDSGKQQAASQSIAGGIAFVGVSIGPAASTTCDNVIIGTFTLDISGTDVSVRESSLQIAPDALSILITGDFSICLEVSATIDITIIIIGMGIDFGPPIAPTEPGVEPPAPSLVQIPIDSFGDALAPVENFGGVDYTVAGVLIADSSDVPGGNGPEQTVTVNLTDLGLKSVQTVYMGGHGSFVPDVGNGALIATAVFEYAEGGSPTTLDFVLGTNTAEWSYGRPEHTTNFGAVQHALPPILYSFTSMIDSAFEYTGHEYFVSVGLDATRTLSCIRLELTDPSSYSSLRHPAATQPTWSSQAIMALTLEGAPGIPDVTTAAPCGTTVGCVTDADCGAGEACIGGQCETGGEPCTIDGDCGAGETCDAGSCVPVVGTCSDDADCGTGETCVSGQCETGGEACAIDGDCGAGETCVSGSCIATTGGCMLDTDCAVGETCVDGQCVIEPGACVDDSNCATDETCVDGVCVPSTEGETFTAATIVHRGSEQIIVGSTVDPSLGHQTDGNFDVVEFALSGDGNVVWYTTHTNFPDEGDQGNRVWSINVDGTGAQRSTVSDVFLNPNGAPFLVTDQDGSTCVGDAEFLPLFRASPGGGAERMFDPNPLEMLDSPRGNMALTGDGETLYFVDSRQNDNAYWSYPVSQTDATPSEVLRSSSFSYEGDVLQRFDSFAMDSAGANYIIETTNLVANNLPRKWALLAGPGSVFQDVFADEWDILLPHLSDDGTMAYCVLGSSGTAAQSCFVQPLGGGFSGTEVQTPGGTGNLGDMTGIVLSADGTRFRAISTSCAGCSGGQSFLQTVGGNDRRRSGSRFSGNADLSAVELSDDGATMVAIANFAFIGLDTHVYVLHDGTDGLAGFPTIESIAYSFDDEADALILRVVASSSSGIEDVLVLPMKDGLDPSEFIEFESNPFFPIRATFGGFTLVDTDTYEITIGLSGKRTLIDGSYSLRISVLDALKNRATFGDIAAPLP